MWMSFAFPVPRVCVAIATEVKGLTLLGSNASNCCKGEIKEAGGGGGGEGCQGWVRGATKVERKRFDSAINREEDGRCFN